MPEEIFGFLFPVSLSSENCIRLRFLDEFHQLCKVPYRWRYPGLWLGEMRVLARFNQGGQIDFIFPYFLGYASYKGQCCNYIHFCKCRSCHCQYDQN